MTTLTIIYAADRKGNFVDPKTKKCWNIPEDREFFRETIKGKSIICGRKTFESDYRGLVEAKSITILVSSLRIHGGEFKTAIDFIYNKKGKLRTRYPITSERSSILSALCDAQYGSDFKYQEEIICIGGKQTIEALAPFASRILLTHIGAGKLWLPEAIYAEIDTVSTMWRFHEGKGFYRTFIPDIKNKDNFMYFELERDYQINF